MTRTGALSPVISRRRSNKLTAVISPAFYISTISPVNRGKILARVDWHVGGNALWVIHLALASREKEQVSPMGWWLQPTALLIDGSDFTEKVLPAFEPRPV